MMKNFALPCIQKMNAYIPPVNDRLNYSGMLMDFNERLQPVSQLVRDALLSYCMNGNICMYPQYNRILTQLAEYCSVEENQLLLTNGSGQAIDIIFRTIVSSGDRVIIPEPSFSLFEQYASVLNARVESLVFDENFNFPTESLLRKLDSTVRLLVICNPNNPTGTIISVDTIESILKKSPNTLVYVDEAYFEFSNVTAIQLLNRYENLIISRTFSKAFGLAALRLGYIIASPTMIVELNKVRGPVDVNMPALVAASAALEDVDSMNAYVDEVMTLSKPLLESFLQGIGVDYYSSSANFILFKPWIDSGQLFEKLKNLGVRVRMRSGGLLRITVGTLKQTQLLISLLTELV